MPEYQVPFSPLGNLIHEVTEDSEPIWRDNAPFWAKMTIDWLEPGASIKRVLVLRDADTGASYMLFVDDLVEFLKNSIVHHGIVEGRWRVKRTGRKTFRYTIVKVGD